MNFNELLTRLIYLTKRNNISNSEIGAIIQLDRQSMSGRAARNSKFKNDEIEKIEKHYNIVLSDIFISKNSFLRCYDCQIAGRRSHFGSKIKFLQQKNNLSNIQTAVLLNISENEFMDIIEGKAAPDVKLLDNIKTNFEVSIDWILYG